MRVTIINGDPRTVLVTGGIVMEPDDNFSLINSYNIEECQPRQLPQAFTCNKVTPMPLVPDVSLVFDSKPKESRHIPYDQLDNSPTLQENGGTSKPEDQGPRKVKPSPIAPLPNETYAAWRARACNAPTLSKSILPVATLKSGAKYGFGSSKNDDSAAFERVGEPSTTVPYGISCHEDFTPKTDESNYVCLMEKTLDHYARGRALSGLKVSHQNGEISESLRIQNKITPSRSLTSRPGTSRERACSQNFHVSSPVNYKNLHSFGNSSENQSIPVHPRFIENECVSDEASVVGKVKQAASSHYMVQDHASREVVGDFDRVNSWDESSVPGKVSAKKRDTMRDLYRIVQLQNEQLKSLQAQVEKLLKRNITEQPLSFLPTKPKGCGSVICIEEGTQTVSEPDGMLSVGVMTSFMDLNMCSSDPGGDSVPDNGSHCTCIGCPGRTPLIGEAANDTGSEECNSQEINCNTNLMHTSSNSVGRKYEAPRSLVRNLRNMHQVIEEETESDESTKRCDEIASQIKHNHHNGKPNIHQECDGRVLNLSRNKPARVYNNGGKSKSKTTSSDVGKVKSKSSNPETAFSEKTQEKCEQNYRPQEKPKHCLGHTSVAHKTVTAKSQHNDDEMTMTLNGVDLQTVTEPQLSPEPSIHVDIQDYKDFSGEMEIPSDQDSDYSGNEDSCSESGEEEDLASLECRQNPCNSKGNKAEKEEGNGGKVGWTFYNNVLGQVNKLLENQKRTHLPQGFSEGGLHDMNLRTNRPEPSSNPGPASRSPPRGPQFPYQDINIHKALTSPTMEVVREATLQHLRQLGINLPNEQLRNNFSSPVSSNSVANPGIRDLQDGRRVTFDPRTNRGGIVGERRPTETSLRIKALALKYLSDEQLASCGFMGHKDSSNPESAEILGQPSNLARGMIGEMSSSADFTLYGMNGTNLSFTTLRYLQRYHLLPSNGAGPAGIWRHQEGIQETNFMESGLSKGPDLGDTKSPGHIDYTNDYMEGLRQGANMAMGLAGKAHSSTPATKVDHALPSAKMTDSKKEVYVLQNGRDFENGSRDVNGMGNQVVQSEKKITTKPRSKGKRHGFQAQRDKECERNAISNGIPEKAARERPLGGNVLRANDQKQRVHNESLRSSNILDITALRQQPKLL